MEKIAIRQPSPSGAEQWFACPGSLRKTAGLYDEYNPDSGVGMAAHKVREGCLVDGTEVEDRVGEWVEEQGVWYQVERQWVDYLQPGIDRIREAKGMTWGIEQKVPLDPWIPGRSGIIDAAGYSKDLIIIDDLKFGAGNEVKAERNKQLMIYALAYWHNFARHRTKAQRFLLRIDQPRVAGLGDEWETTLDDLLEFAEELTRAVARTKDPKAPLVAGLAQCHFCLAGKQLLCETHDRFVLGLLGLTSDDLDDVIGGEPVMVTTETLNPERRSYILQHATMITGWLNRLRASALKDAIDGEPVPGLKAVETLGDRAWVDEEAAEAYWKTKMPVKDLYIQKFKGPAAIERIAGSRNWAKAQDLIHRPPGKPALVPESDKRPALSPLVDLLDDLDDRSEEFMDALTEVTEVTEVTELTDNSLIDDLI